MKRGIILKPKMRSSEKDVIFSTLAYRFAHSLTFLHYASSVGVLKPWGAKMILGTDIVVWHCLLFSVLTATATGFLALFRFLNYGAFGFGLAWGVVVSLVVVAWYVVVYPSRGFMIKSSLNSFSNEVSKMDLSWHTIVKATPMDISELAEQLPSPQFHARLWDMVRGCILEHGPCPLPAAQQQQQQPY
jgi:hypothetical protein